jgi:hypothetical protein
LRGGNLIADLIYDSPCDLVTARKIVIERMEKQLSSAIQREQAELADILWTLLETMVSLNELELMHGQTTASGSERAKISTRGPSGEKDPARTAACTVQRSRESPDR